MYDLNSLRQNEFPLSQEYLFFNHAGMSPLPVRTRDKMQAIIGELAAQPAKFSKEKGRPMMDRFGEKLAAYINAESAQEIVPITTTSVALNAIAQAVNWQAGDNILFCEVEFPSNAYPWMSLERDGVETRQVPAVNGGLTLAALKPLVDARTRMVAVSAIQFFTGHRTHLESIGAFCHEHQLLFVVDAIQAIGHMKMDVQAMHIDVLATGGQKSLLSAPGTGFMYVCNAVAERLSPRNISPNACRDFLHWLDYDLTLQPGAHRFKGGTTNYAGLFATLESLSLLQELGLDNIDQHTTQLATKAIDLLTDRGYEVITPCDEHGPIVTFRTGLSVAETDALVEALQARHVSVAGRRDRPGNAHIRLSFHCYNTLAEVGQFMAILDDLRGIAR